MKKGAVSGKKTAQATTKLASKLSKQTKKINELIGEGTDQITKNLKNIQASKMFGELPKNLQVKAVKTMKNNFKLQAKLNKMNDPTKTLKVNPKTGKAKIVNVKVKPRNFGKAAKLGKKALSKLSGKISSKVASGATKTAKTAGSLAKSTMKGLKALGKSAKALKKIPVVGILFAVGSVAMCSAQATGAMDGTSDEIDEGEKAEGVAACMITMVIDIVIEVVSTVTKFATAAAMGPLAAVAVLVQLLVMLFDLLDPCAFDRPMFDDQQLLGQKNTTLYSAWYSNFYQAFYGSVPAVTDQYKEMLESAGLKPDGIKKYMNKESTIRTIKEAFKAGLEEAKYPTPQEFKSSISVLDRLTPEDQKKYDAYVREYYAINHLEIPVVSFEKIKSIVLRVNEVNKAQRMFYDMISKSIVKINNVSKEALKQYKKSGEAMTSMFKSTRLTMEKMRLLSSQKEKLSQQISKAKAKNNLVRQKIDKQVLEKKNTLSFKNNDQEKKVLVDQIFSLALKSIGEAEARANPNSTDKQKFDNLRNALTEITTDEKIMDRFLAGENAEDIIQDKLNIVGMESQEEMEMKSFYDDKQDFYRFGSKPKSRDLLVYIISTILVIIILFVMYQYYIGSV